MLVEKKIIQIDLSYTKEGAVKSAFLTKWPAVLNTDDVVEVLLNCIDPDNIVVVFRFRPNPNDSNVPKNSNPFTGFGPHFTFQSMMRRDGLQDDDEIQIYAKKLVPYWDTTSTSSRDWVAELWVADLNSNIFVSVLDVEDLPAFDIKVKSSTD